VSDPKTTVIVYCNWPGVGWVKYDDFWNDEPKVDAIVDLQLSKDHDDKSPPIRPFRVLSVETLNAPHDPAPGANPLLQSIQREIEVRIEPA
jgi:hypothetical protein